MSLSDSDSPLSSPPESDDEPLSPVFDHIPIKPKRSTRKRAVTVTKIKLKAPVRSPSPVPKRRKTEPPHVHTLADSPELAFIVMFRSRFTDAFKGVPNLGCQDIELGIVDSTPSEQIELLLCAIIGLVFRCAACFTGVITRLFTFPSPNDCLLTIAKFIRRGHYNRALEEAISTHRTQWPREWERKNPLPGGKHFKDLDASQRLVLLRALIHWALVSSDHIRSIIQENYKGSRREDDLNVAISVQPWGRDGDKRRYWLIEGQDDTPFRLYRESNPALKTKEWYSIAGTIDELKAIVRDLEEDDCTKNALALKDKINVAINRFEEGENKRRKREYRATRKAMFSQNNGVSLYEGRTRGRRIRYNYSDDEGGKEVSEADDIIGTTRRSTRSKASTPAADAPRFTASGRQIRKPNTGAYGEIKTNGSHGASAEMSAEISGTETGTAEGLTRPQKYNLEDDEVEARDSGVDDEVDEWDGDSEGDDDDEADESGWEESGFAEGDPKKSLRIILKVNGKRLGADLPGPPNPATTTNGAPQVDNDIPMVDQPATVTVTTKDQPSSSLEGVQAAN
ncbi:hypothetical protein EDC01DRAFT_630888 [Geopyxis carbonaria]|nr:hypothetical protein EDC01DRAFT_630888 [Geopyxis carbonaria]